MIVKELYTVKRDGTKLYRTYSNLKRYIKQLETGHLYKQVIDVENAPYTYKETAKSIKN